MTSLTPGTRIAYTNQFFFRKIFIEKKVLLGFSRFISDFWQMTANTKDLENPLAKGPL